MFARNRADGDGGSDGGAGGYTNQTVTAVDSFDDTCLRDAHLHDLLEALCTVPVER